MFGNTPLFFSAQVERCEIWNRAEEVYRLKCRQADGIANRCGGGQTEMSKKTSTAVVEAPQKEASLKTGLLKTVANVIKTSKKAQKGLQKGCSAVSRVTGYEQHIAVFGESGSGKTTLLSVFYGKQQSVRFIDESGYELLANDATQGNQLLSLYNKVRDNLIEANRLHSTRYEFSVRPATREKKSKNAIRLVWHDYPGEWLTETHLGVQNKEKNETFERLVKADVAYFLVDAQKLKDAGGPEETVRQFQGSAGTYA